MNKEMGQRIEKLLINKKLPYYAWLLVLALFVPLLNANLILDDYVHKVLITGSLSLGDIEHPNYIYTYLDGEKETASYLRKVGAVPWWTPDDFKFSFWRPLPQPTHVLDYRLFPDSPWLMRLHTLLWYLALAVAIFALYRRTITSQVVAGLALVLYVIDDSHALPISFIATRNSTIAVFLAVLSLIFYIRWREDTRPAFLMVCIISLMAALWSNEGAIATTAYFFAYECFLSKRKFSNRFAVLLLFAIIIISWRLAYDYLGYGVVGSSLYIDPLSDPGRFLSALLNHIPVLLAGQWSLSPSDIYIMLGPDYQALFSLYGLGVSAFVVAVLLPILREPENRFWLLGMVLALVPCATTFPSDRMLYFVGIGAHALLAGSLYFYFGKLRSRSTTPLKTIGKVFSGVIVVTFVLIHVVMAPVMMYSRAYAFNWFGDSLEAGAQSLDREAAPGKTILVLNVIHPYLASNLFATRAAANKPLPDNIYLLSVAMNNYITTSIYRPDAYSIELSPDYGYQWGIFRGSSHPFEVGDSIELDDVRVDILKVAADGYPLKVRFVFRYPLEDSRYVWRQKVNFFEFAPMRIPRIGETVRY